MGFWRLKEQPSSNITAWRILEDKKASKANLVRRGIGLTTNICSLCGEEEETTSHLFSTRIVVPGLCGLSDMSGWGWFQWIIMM